MMEIALKDFGTLKACMRSGSQGPGVGCRLRMSAHADWSVYRSRLPQQNQQNTVGLVPHGPSAPCIHGMVWCVDSGLW